MQSSQLQPLPPFINDKFALKVLLDLGGKASQSEIREHVKNTYDLSTFPHALQYLGTQLNGLMMHGFLDRTRSKTGDGQRFFITEEARPVVERMLSE